jgi:short-subunit dehydrogenase
LNHRGYGHVVGFSSIDSIRGVAVAPVYSGAKAFCARYLEAERNKYAQKNIPIFITEICPGWVNSNPHTDYSLVAYAYWVETLDTASKEIFDAIKQKVPVAYITKRWEKVAKLLTDIPLDLYNALCARPGGAL